MYLCRLAACALAMLLSFSAPALELVTEDDPPHNMMKDGKVVGIATDKLREAFKRINAPARIELMPWARAYQSALEQPDFCVFSAARTAPREPLFKWVGPLAAMDWVLYTRADHPAKVSKLEDIKNDVIGGYLQDVISVWLASQGYRVETVPNDALNPKKLLSGRFNYWASSRPRASSLLAKDKLEALIVPALTFGHTDLYLACNPAVPTATVEDLNTALRRMAEDGSARKIDATYSP